MPISKKVRTHYRREENINPTVKAMVAAVEAGLLTGDRIRVFIVACRVIDVKGYVTVTDVMGEDLHYLDPRRHYVSDQLTAFKNDPRKKKRLPKALLKYSGRTIPGTTRPHSCLVLTATGRKLWQLLKDGRDNERKTV